MEESKDVKKKKKKKKKKKSSEKCSPLVARPHPNAVMELWKSRHHLYQSYPALLPLPLPLPRPLLLYILPTALLTKTNYSKPKTYAKKTTWKQKPAMAASSDASIAAVPLSQDYLSSDGKPSGSSQAMVIARRPDSGGTEGAVIPLLANHFLVQFDASQKIYHYDVNISPRPSKEIARMIKRKLVEDNSDILSGALPVFDGHKNLYSPVEFQEDNLEFFVSLPMATRKCLPGEDAASVLEKQKNKLFKVYIRLASKLSGEDLNKYLKEEQGRIQH